MKIGEFFIDLVVDGAKGELTIGNMVKEMGKLEVASVGELAILAALATKFEQVTKATIASGEALYDYKGITGGSTESLQRWAAVASHIGMNAGQLSQIFRTLGHDLEMGHLGKGFGGLENLFQRVPGFAAALAHIQPNQQEKILEFLRKSKEFQRIPAYEKEAFLSGTPLAAMQRAVTTGAGGISRADFLAFQKEAAMLSQTDIANFHEMGDSMQSAENQATRIGTIIAKWFGPETQAFLKEEADALKVIADWLETINVNTGKAGTAKNVLLRQGTYLSHPQEAVKDFFIGSSMLGRDLAHGLDEATKNMHPLSPPSIMLGPLGRPTKVEQTNHNSVNFNGTKFDETQTPHKVAKALTAIHQNTVLQLYLGEIA